MLKTQNSLLTSSYVMIRYQRRI